MKIVASLAGAFLASALMLVIVDVYMPGYNIFSLIYSPLFLILFIIWSVGFGYATIEANLKKKIVAVLMIESIALAGSSIYYMIAHEMSQENIFGLVFGIGAIVIVMVLRSGKE